MTADISAFVYLVPIVVFLLVVIILYALFAKTKILGESMFIQIFTAFIIATIFISFIGVRTFLTAIIPWFAVLLISLFLILAIIGFVGKTTDFHKPLQITFLIVLVIVFVVAAFVVFSHNLSPYLPWNSAQPGNPGNPDALQVSNWFYSSHVFGAVILLIVSGLVSWVLVKTKS